MALLIAVLTSYLAHVLWRLVLTVTWIGVIIGGSVNQIYTCGQGISCYTAWLLITTIALSITKILTKRLDAWQSDRLVVCWFSLGYFFKRFESFFFFIRPLAFSTTNIHFTNANRGLEHRLRLGFNGFIEHFVLKIQLLISIIHLSLDKR